jgi:LPXTG-site transpeptidase (sortase) family protein
MLLLCLCLLAAAATGDGSLMPNAPVTGQFAWFSGVTGSSAPIAASTIPGAGPIPERVADSRPSRLVIPAISVDAAIEARGLEPNRNLATPVDFNDVAWFNQGPAPGNPGNALINGHVNWWTGDAVFTRLAQLRVGDEVVVIRQDGASATFKVSGRRILAANARDSSLFASSTVASVTLITCSGPWDVRLGSDSQRLLVSATLV